MVHDDLTLPGERKTNGTEFRGAGVVYPSCWVASTKQTHGYTTVMYQVVYVTMHKVSQRQMLVWDQPYDGADGAASDVPVIIFSVFHVSRQYGCELFLFFFPPPAGAFVGS